MEDCAMPTLAGIIFALFLFARPNSTDGQDPAPPGKLYDIGGYRLHANIKGKGSPTVVLLSGMGDTSVVWDLVLPDVAHFARVCAYDRAGDAWSDLGPVPRTMRQDVFELHLLMKEARLPHPFVLVGASYGGLLARMYAMEYPGEVGGVVLVDSTHEETILSFMRMRDGKRTETLRRVRELSQGRTIPAPQTMKTSPPKPATDTQIKEWEGFRKEVGPPKIDPPFDRLSAGSQRIYLWAQANPKLSGPSEDYMGEEFQALADARRSRPQPLGAIPLISLRAGAPGPTPSPEGLAGIKMTMADWNRERDERSADHARLSTNSRWYVAPGSGHHIHLEDPGLVVAAIRRVVEAARSGKPL
jgi:pimeloyl-ACP methyl ester carboxylesterase